MKLLLKEKKIKVFMNVCDEQFFVRLNRMLFFGIVHVFCSTWLQLDYIHSYYR